MGNQYAVTQIEAMQARSKWSKKKLMAKALMDVIAGAGPEGDGAEYLTHHRIATAAWTQFSGGPTASHKNRRTKAFGVYTRILEGVIAAKLRSSMRATPVEQLTKSVSEPKSNRSESANEASHRRERCPTRRPRLRRIAARREELDRRRNARPRARA